MQNQALKPKLIPSIAFFCVPKSFSGHIGIIQRNALRSWRAICPKSEILIFGEEEGIREACVEIGALHISDVATNEYGTPLLNDVFAKATNMCNAPVMCYVNADLILPPNFLEPLAVLTHWRSRFLMIGECWNLEVRELLDFAQMDTWHKLKAKVRFEGKRRGQTALDFFAFPRGLYSNYLPLALGRGGFDNWLVWEARRLGAPVVDVTEALTVIHQQHDYGHIAGGRAWAHDGLEAARNRQLAGGIGHMYYLADATHRWSEGRVRRRWLYLGRIHHRILRFKYHFSRR
ncbi:MAG: hypothetical protein RMM51_01780 [Verrucomicrobiae bacterium]|nr:hypothetical protein [Verrucomicrobiae bacterium]